MEKLTLKKGISTDEKIQFINEMVILHKLTILSTSDIIHEDKINIETNDHEELKYIISQIDKTKLTVSIDNDDTIILLNRL